MNTNTETIAWNPIEDGPPEEEGLYLVTRRDGKYSAVIMENWHGLPYGAQWDGDPPHGGKHDGGYPEEGPVIAWAELPRGYTD
jgi:hypothetical protein